MVSCAKCKLKTDSHGVWCDQIASGLLLLPIGAKSFLAWNKTVAHVTAE